MLDAIMPALNVILALGGLGLVLVVLVALGFATPVLDALKPVLVALGKGLAWVLENVVGPALAWFWSVLKRGLTDIFDDWVTVVTVGTIGVVIFLYGQANHAIEINHARRELNTCRATLAKVAPKRLPAPTPEPQRWEFTFPKW